MSERTVVAKVAALKSEIRETKRMLEEEKAKNPRNGRLISSLCMRIADKEHMLVALARTMAKARCKTQNDEEYGDEG